MRYLLDEMLSETAARALDALGCPGGDRFLHILDLVPQGTPDEAIPPLCREHGIEALITMNVRDFGARKHYYAALLESGIHVVIARPAKQQPDAGQQVALVSGHFESMRSHLGRASSPTSIKLTQSSLSVRDLEQLIKEVTGLP